MTTDELYLFVVSFSTSTSCADSKWCKLGDTSGMRVHTPRPDIDREITRYRSRDICIYHGGGRIRREIDKWQSVGELFRKLGVLLKWIHVSETD